MNILITGYCGFLGFHTTKRLIELGHNIIGIDNINNYYDPNLKKARINELHGQLHACHIDIRHLWHLDEEFDWFHPDVVIHLAAMPGVQNSIENPEEYNSNNINGFFNILECCRKHGVKRLIYASSSSIYGGKNMYAASKIANEAMAKAYEIYGVRTIGLRFFSVYGTWGRPDMILSKFASKWLKNESIDLYNQGQDLRDFTHVSNIVSAIEASITYEGSELIFDVGSGHTVKVYDFAKMLAERLNVSYNDRINMLPARRGDITVSLSNIEKTCKELGWSPHLNHPQHITGFTKWYREYYKV